MNTVDRYILRHMIGAYASVIVSLVAMLSLENMTRLTASISDTDSPLILLATLMATLVPEYLGIAIPVATYLSIAMAVRRLSLGGEWQIFEATGLSPLRIMAIPMALAILSASAQLAIRLQVQPVGERALDRLSGEIRRGLHGIAFKPGEILTIDSTTTMLADRAEGETPGTLANVIVRRGGDVLSAARAVATRDDQGAVGLTLSSGTMVHRRADGGFEALHFARYSMNLMPAAGAARPKDAAERYDRLTLAHLLPRIRRELAHSGAPAPALAALMGRIQSAAFCLMLPWLGLALGVPPKRRAGGAGMLLGIGLIVINLRSTAFVEDRFGAMPVTAAIVHTALWTAATIAIVRAVRAHGPGAIDEVLAKATERVLALVRRRPVPAPA